MGWLQPLLLGIAAAAAVPVVLHLMQRHQGPRIVFPALRYLRRAEREHARRIRLRQLLLMILRVAAIMLLAAAAARPFLRAGGAAHVPTAVAIILDNSLSTGAVSGDRRVLDDLKARALETLDAAGPEDRFWLIRAGAPWEPAWPGDATRTAERVRATTAGFAAASLPAAVEQGRAVLEAGADGRAAEIHLLTDLQATGLAGSRPGEPGVPLLVWAPGSTPPPNRAVTAVEIGGGALPPAGLRTTAAVTVTGSADSAVDVRLAIDGRVVGAATPGSGSAAVLALPGLPAGPVWGYAETDPDALRADDRRYFATRIAEPPRVAVMPDLGIAATALDVLAESGRIRRSAVGDADLVFSAGLADASTIPAGAAVVILPPESAAELPALNRRLSDAGIAWRLEPGGSPGEGRLSISGGDPLHASLAAVRIFEAFRPVPAAARQSGDSVLLRLEDGTAWAVRGERPGGGAWMLLASPLSEAASSLPASAALVPLLDRLTGAWAFAAATSAGVEPGAEIPLPAGTTDVVLPDGTVEPVTAGSLYRPGAAGVYRFASEGTVLEALAVNPPAAESDLRRADPADMGRVFAGYPVTVASQDGWPDTIYRSRLGSEVWRSAALLAGLLLLLESVVAAAGARAGSRPVPSVDAPV